MTKNYAVENILVSSTRQWNPGDEFIWFGVRRLFEASFKRKMNYLLWNRNPDVFVEGWANPQIKPKLYTNCLNSPVIDLIDRVVLAGSPEWLGRPLEDVYRSLLVRKNVPLYAIGVGSGISGVILSDYEHEVLTRPNAVVICRQENLREALQYQGVQRAIALPCPALFSASKFKEFERLSDESKLSCKIGLIAQADAVSNQAVSSNLYQSCQNLLQSPAIKEFETDIICFYIDEFLKFARHKSNVSVRYAYQSEDYEALISDYDVIISTRLHGAIHALSMGVPAALVSDGNYRIESAAGMFSELLPVFPNFELAYDWAANFLKDRMTHTFSKRMHQFKTGVFTRYLSLLAGDIN